MIFNAQSREGPPGRQGGGKARFWEDEGGWQDFRFLVPVGPKAESARLQFLGTVGSSVEIKGLKIQEQPVALAALMEKMQAHFAERFISLDPNLTIPFSVPDSLKASADSLWRPYDVDRLLTKQILAMGVRDMVWAEETLNDLGVRGLPIGPTRNVRPTRLPTVLKSIHPISLKHCCPKQVRVLFLTLDS